MGRGIGYWLGVWIRTLRPVSGYPNPRYRPPEPRFRYVWWLLDPTHSHHCDDCKRLAAGSPYVAPGSGGNEIHCTCGDGTTACGIDCTCILSYHPPSLFNPDWADVSMTPERHLLKWYTHGQIWYLMVHPELLKRIQIGGDRRRWPRNVPELRSPDEDEDPLGGGPLG